MAATDLLRRLRTEPTAERHYLWIVNARTAAGVPVVGRFGEEGWNTDADEDPPHVHFHRTVMTAMNMESSLLSRGGTIFGGVGVPTYGTIEIFNYDGQWDAWRTYSVDELEVVCIMVGWLRDGTRVRYSDGMSDPELVGVGIDRPQVGDVMRIFIRSRLGLLEREAQPLTFAPFCPVFPDPVLVPGQSIDFVDVFDLPAGSYTIEGWFYSEDANLSGQVLIQKDLGAGQGWQVNVGTGGSGVLQAVHREQSVATSQTAANIIKSRRWTHVALRWNSSTSTRTILLDGAAAVTTGAVTGNPANTAAAFRLGAGLYGRLSEWRLWSVARTDAQIRDNMFQHLTGGEAGLLGYLPLSEESEFSTADQKTGSVITGTLTAGITRGKAAWVGESIAGQHRRRILGSVRSVELVARDPVKLIYEAVIGPALQVGAVYSTANVLAGGSYTADLARGLVTVVAGTSVGRMTADVFGETPWGYAMAFDGVDDVATCALQQPAGSVSMSALASTRTYAAVNRIICGWNNGIFGGMMLLHLAGTGVNRLTAQVRNDAATDFRAFLDRAVLDDEYFHAVLVRDLTAMEVRLYLNGRKVATTALAGAFTLQLGTFGVGRFPDQVLSHFDGGVDAVGVFSRVLTDTEIEELALRELRASDVADLSLYSGWNANEGAGGSAANLVAGKPALTLSGATWAPSRCHTIDLILLLLADAGRGLEDLDVAKACLFLRDVPGKAGWVIETGTSLDHLQRILQGVGAGLREEGAVFSLGLVRGPEGDPVLRITERDIPASAEISGEAPLGKAAWGLDVGWGRNYSPFTAEEVAQFITTQPDVYRFAVEAWRMEPARDASVLGNFPGAQVLRIDSPLQLRRDAARLGALLLPYYLPSQVFLSVAIDKQATGICLGAVLELLVTEVDGAERFEGAESYAVIRMRREDTAYQLLLWRRTT